MFLLNYIYKWFIFKLIWVWGLVGLGGGGEGLLVNVFESGRGLG